MMNKSLATNLLALGLTLPGLALTGTAGDLVLSTGLYALSGGVTNWLAIHMLFERPGSPWLSEILSVLALICCLKQGRLAATPWR